MLSRVIEFSLRHRLLVLLLVVLLIFSGLTALRSLSTEFLPDLSSPIVSLVVSNPGLAPQEMEMLITRPIEAALQGTPKVESVRSSSMLGLSLVTITFQWGVDYYFALQLVNLNLAPVVSRFPPGTTGPIFSNAAQRLGEVMEYYLKGPLTPRELRELADYQVRYRMQAARGVALVTTIGGEVGQYQVLVDLNKLRYYDVALGEVIRALQESNLNFTGSVLTEGPVEFTIRGLGRLTQFQDLYRVVVATRGGRGAGGQDVPIYLKDVATLTEGAALRRGMALIDGQEVVLSTVTKQYGVDTMPVIREVRRAIQDIRSFLPSGTEIRAYFDQSELIGVSIRNLRDALLIGALAVLLVVFLFLANLRATFIVGVTLPISVIGTFIFMKLFHETVNVMSLGGIAVGLGIMIDAAIVDTENIYRHLALHRDDSFRATLLGAVEVRRPVAYSTGIIITVFAPLMFLTGFQGRLFSPFAFTIVVSMLVGFALSLTLTPMLCYSLFSGGGTRRTGPFREGAARILGRLGFSGSSPAGIGAEGKGSSLGSGAAAAGESWLTRQVARGYTPALDYVIAHPGRYLAAVLVILVLSVFLIPLVGTELFPAFDENALFAIVYTPPGTSLDETVRIARQVEGVIKKAPDVKQVILHGGRAEGAPVAEGVNIAEMHIELVERKERGHSIEEIRDWMRRGTSSIRGAVVVYTTPLLGERIQESITGVYGDLAVNLFGDDLDVLREEGQRLKSLMAGVPGLADIRIEEVSAAPEISILVDRDRAGRYGLNPGLIAEAAETALGGRVVTTVLKRMVSYDVFVRLEEKYRAEPEKLGALLIDTPAASRGGRMKVPLAAVADIWQDVGPSIISHEDLQRRVQITANVRGGDINQIIPEIQRRARSLHLPKGYFVTFGGNYASQQATAQQLRTILIISGLLVFVLLLMAFNSVWQPLLILITIPLALMGGVWALFLTAHTFNLSSLIGFVAHFGLTVQKGVILVECINDLRDAGLPLEAAVAQAARMRMRPVLMTAFAASLAVLPLALGVGAGSEIQQPMAIVLIGGLITSTPLVLLTLPLMYQAVAKATQR